MIYIYTHIYDIYIYIFMIHIYIYILYIATYITIFVLGLRSQLVEQLPISQHRPWEWHIAQSRRYWSSISIGGSMLEGFLFYVWEHRHDCEPVQREHTILQKTHCTFGLPFGIIWSLLMLISALPLSPWPWMAGCVTVFTFSVVTRVARDTAPQFSVDQMGQVHTPAELQSIKSGWWFGTFLFFSIYWE